MRRPTAFLVAAMAAATTLVLPSSTPPAAASVVCADAGELTAIPGLPDLAYVGIGSVTPHLVDVSIGTLNRTHSFLLLFGLGACVHVRVPPSFVTPSGAGLMKGYCGHFAGTGTFGGAPFAFVSTGALLVFTGHVSGVAGISPTPGDNYTCGRADLPQPVTEVNPLSSSRSDENQFRLTRAKRVASSSAARTFGGVKCSNVLPATEQLQRVADVEPSVAPLVGVQVHLGVHVWTMQPCVGAVVLS